MKIRSVSFVCNFFRCLPSSLCPGPDATSDPLAPTQDVKSAEQIDREWQQSVSKYDTERKRLLAEADRQANDGPYRPDWATLIKYQQPQWYKDAKFGIFIHWGVYSVPAAENEWYPRNMYDPKKAPTRTSKQHFAKGDDREGLQGSDSSVPRRDISTRRNGRSSSRPRARNTSFPSPSITTASPCTTPASPTGRS